MWQKLHNNDGPVDISPRLGGDDNKTGLAQNYTLKCFDILRTSLREAVIAKTLYLGTCAKAGQSTPR